MRTKTLIFATIHVTIFAVPNGGTVRDARVTRVRHAHPVRDE